MLVPNQLTEYVFFPFHLLKIYENFQNIGAVRLDLIYCSNDNFVGLADFLLRATLPLSPDERSQIGEQLS